MDKKVGDTESEDKEIRNLGEDMEEDLKYLEDLDIELCEEEEIWPPQRACNPSYVCRPNANIPCYPACNPNPHNDYCYPRCKPISYRPAYHCYPYYYS